MSKNMLEPGVAAEVARQVAARLEKEGSAYLALKRLGRSSRDAANSPDRRLLDRLRRWPTGHRLQESSYSRAVDLLDRLEPGAGASLKGQVARLRQQAERATNLGRQELERLYSEKWFQPAPQIYANLLAPPSYGGRLRPDGRSPIRHALSAGLSEGKVSALTRRYSRPVSVVRRIVRDKTGQRLLRELIGVKSLPLWARREIEHFRQRMLQQGHSPRRIELSVQRMLGRICASKESGGIERRWDDLSAKEQQDAIRLEIRLEELWLGSTPGHERAAARTSELGREARRPRQRRKPRLGLSRLRSSRTMDASEKENGKEEDFRDPPKLTPAEIYRIEKAKALGRRSKAQSTRI